MGTLRASSSTFGYVWPSAQLNATAPFVEAPLSRRLQSPAPFVQVFLQLQFFLLGVLYPILIALLASDLSVQVLISLACSSLS